MKNKKIVLAALAASLMLSVGSVTVFAAESAAPDVCPYVCIDGEDCHDGNHGGNCPVADCENHSEHCQDTAGSRHSYSSRRRSACGGHHSASDRHHSSAGRHHGSSGRHH